MAMERSYFEKDKKLWNDILGKKEEIKEDLIDLVTAHDPVTEVEHETEIGSSQNEIEDEIKQSINLIQTIHNHIAELKMNVSKNAFALDQHEIDKHEYLDNLKTFHHEINIFNKQLSQVIEKYRVVEVDVVDVDVVDVDELPIDPSEIPDDIMMPDDDIMIMPDAGYDNGII